MCYSILCNFFRLSGYVVISHHANISKMYKHWGSFFTHCKYILYILKKESPVIPLSNELCVDSAPKPKIESQLPNVVIREELVQKCRKNIQISGKILCISELITVQSFSTKITAKNHVVLFLGSFHQYIVLNTTEEFFSQSTPSNL